MSKTSYPSDQQDKFMLRLPDGMRDRIRVAADANKRSMNAEIVGALEEKYPAPVTGDRQAAWDREFTVKMIDRLLSELRANMIRQLDGGDPNMQLAMLVRDFLPGKPDT